MYRLFSGRWICFGLLLILLMILALQSLPLSNRPPASLRLPAPLKGNSTPVAAVDHPPQGIFESCAPGLTMSMLASCESRLATIAHGGFTRVLNYDVLYGSAANLTAYARFAAAHGVKIIWAVDDPEWWDGPGINLFSRYDNLASTCSCTTNAALLAYLISLTKTLPATWGYYIADEPPESRHDSVKAYDRRLKALDPTHPTMVATGEDCSTMGKGLDPFVDTADVVAADYYPVGTDCPIAAWATIARTIQRYADSNGNAGVVTIAQSFAWSEYPRAFWVCTPFPTCANAYPTQTQMRQQRDLILRNAHPLMILWYSYFVNGSAQPINGRHWADVQAAARL